ncbi:MAG: polysaccharide pyruvyl transferase CsaB [Firmicutes bacterium]|nr:polysaccharide pyruvyl transferase CsaB [Bacillota bacterium]
MLKVLHLISGGDVGGAKTHVLTLIKELQKTITIRLICFMEGSFADEGRQMGIDVFVIEQEQRYNLNVVDKIIQIIEEENFNLIHSHGARANFITRFIKKKTNIPCVTTVHSDFMLDFKGNVYKHLIYTNLNVFALKKFNYYIAVSEDFRQMLIGRGFPANKIYTIYNGIDYDERIDYKSRLDFLKEKGLSHINDKIIIGILARMHPVKGHEVFIKAAEEVLESNKDVHFLITGKSEELPELSNLIKHYGIEDNIHFIDFVENPYDFLNAIDINVLTSYSESFPYVLLEGAHLLKPTISSAVGGIPMLIKDGVNGFLFKAGDSKGLAYKMKALVDDREKRDVFGKELLKYAKENFSLNQLASEHLNIYENILKCNKGVSIVVSGYYGFGNSGDEAILKSIVRDFKNFAPNTEITALSNSASKTGRDYGIKAINRLNIIDILKTIKNCDLFISGGGSLLQDQTSTRSLLYYLFIIKIALHYNKKVMLYANGIGPINSKSNAERVKRIVNKVSLITLREEYSYKLLKSVGIEGTEVKITADPVLTTEPAGVEIVKSIFAKEGISPDNKYVGVNIRKWPYAKNLDNELIKSLIYLYEEYRLVPLFIPMSQEDVVIMKRIASRLDIPYKVLTNIYEPEELIGIMKQLVMVLAMRLHTLIYSSIAATPMVGLIYDPKIKGYLDYIGQPAAGDVKSIESIMINIETDKIMKDYEKEKDKLEIRMNELKELTKENVKLAFELINM